MESDIVGRLEKLRKLMAAENLDTLLVLIAENRFYLSGFYAEDTQFDESAGALFITDSKLILATDARYREQAEAQAPLYEIYCYKKGLAGEISGILKTLGTRRLGFESRRMSCFQHLRVAEELTAKGLATCLVPADHLVESLRVIKDESEIQATRRALRLAERTFEVFLQTIGPGMTEKQAAWALEKRMREAGAEKLSFPVIAASGPNSALPHAVPQNRTFATGEPLLFDWGAMLDGYCSDTTRTVIMGHPDGNYQKVYRTVLAAQEKAIAAIRPGITGKVVDDIARNHIDQTEFKGAFSHGLGHGTGLAVHEQPRLSPLGDNVLAPGMIVTVEPGIYLPGWGGVRIENQVVVREDGVEVLNSLGTQQFVDPM